MKKLTTRSAEFHKRAADRDLFTKWIFSTPNNLFDQAVMFYPTTNTVIVEDGDEPVFFAPFQAVIMLESLAPKPGLPAKELAAALSAFHEGIVNVCSHMKIREIFFVCADEAVAEFALHHRIHVAGQVIRYKEINGEMVQWAKEHGYKGPLKRTLKLKLPGPEDKLQPVVTGRQ